MRFLFIGPGYPGVPGAGRGSGIGTYLRELTLGLAARGQECHVLVWACASGGKTHSEGKDVSRKAAKTQGIRWDQDIPHLVSRIEQPESRITLHTLRHAYWPIVERFFPDSRDMWNLRETVRRLDRAYRFDWIEIESEEGLALGVQRDFPGRTILRVHTTLAQMVTSRDVPVTGVVRRRLRRETISIENADLVWVSTQYHARELAGRYRLRNEPTVIPIGIRITAFPDRAIVDKHGTGLSQAVFLVVGSADRRKGFDRIRPVLDSFVRQFGPCVFRIVSRCSEQVKKQFNLVPPFPPGGGVEWLADLDDAGLALEYARASAVLHLARYESFGLPLIEAAAHQTPVVATRTGVAEALLTGELAQCLVDGDDSEACARALHAAWQSRPALGREIRRRYLAGFTRDCMVDAFLEGIKAAGGGKRDGVDVECDRSEGSANIQGPVSRIPARPCHSTPVTSP